MIILRQEKNCKCPCKKYIGTDKKFYWFNKSNKIVYKTDCHRSHPIKAEGIFKINKKIIKQ